MAENGYIFVTVGYIVALIVNAKRGSGSVHVLEPVQTGKYWLVRTGPTDYLNCVWNHAFAQRPPWKKNADPVLSTFAMDLAIDFDPLYIGVNHILLCCHSIYTRFTLCQLQHWLYLGLQQSPCWLVCIRPKKPSSHSCVVEFKALSGIFLIFLCAFKMQYVAMKRLSHLFIFFSF